MTSQNEKSCHANTEDNPGTVEDQKALVPSDRNDKIPKPKEFPKLTAKRRKWLDHYLNYFDSKTFFNAMECTRIAYNPKSNGTCRSMSWEIREILTPYIDHWLDKTAFTDDFIKAKLFSLMNAKKIKYFAHQGRIKDMIEVEALDIQAKATDMACKVKGLYKDTHVGVRPVFNINFGSGKDAEQIIDVFPGQ